MPHTVSDANVYDESGRLIGEYTPDGKLIAETIYFNDLPIATLRPKGANAGTPLGLSGTTSGNPANGATAANANNAGNNTSTNRVNVEIFYVHPDHLGTPRVVTRSTIATGANAPASTTASSPGAINKAVWRWDSDPFGTSLGASTPTENPQVITGTATVIQAATMKQNLRFPGQFADGESAKHYNSKRTYGPNEGRYIESDPIGLHGGLSTYGYVGQTPITNIDPTGELAFILPALPPIAEACVAAGPYLLGGVGLGLGLSVPGSEDKTGKCDGNKCPPLPLCSPPSGTVCFIIDLVPPSKPHAPIPGSHYHLWRMNQAPNGNCFWNPIGASPFAPPGAIPCPFVRPPR